MEWVNEVKKLEEYKYEDNDYEIKDNKKLVESELLACAIRICKSKADPCYLNF